MYYINLHIIYIILSIVRWNYRLITRDAIGGMTIGAVTVNTSTHPTYPLT